eukprot:s1069_g6.t1
MTRLPDLSFLVCSTISPSSVISHAGKASASSRLSEVCAVLNCIANRSPRRQELLEVAPAEVLETDVGILGADKPLPPLNSV